MESLSLLNGMLPILSLMSLAVVSSVVFKRLNFPYTVGLVFVGIIIGVLSIYFRELAMFKDLQLTADLVLYLILPVLIFDAALNIDSKVLFRNIVPIGALLAIGVLISAFVVGGLLSLTLGLSFGAMLLFGALISTTDPIAVIALFKEANAPRRLTTIIDGESMSNDATAIVLFGIIFTMTYASPATQTAASASLNIPHAILQFFVVLCGGMAVGAVVGFLGAFICALDKSGRDYQIILSIIMAYSAFIIADKLGFSGVMGTLIAGVVLSLKAEKVIKRKNREQVETIWELFSFLANSFVFLLIGITQAHVFKQSPISKQSLIAIAASIVILLVARYVSVLGCNVPYNFFVKKKNPELVIPHRYSLLLTWGGLRGAIPAALALAIPADYPHHDLIVQMTLSCILFSLFVQGTTIKGLMNKLKIEPELAEIDESVCVKKEYPFPNRALIDLTIPKIVKNCEDEGFFVHEKSSKKQVDYLMRMHEHVFLFRVAGKNIQVIADHKNLGYASTVMYESIAELNQSLGSIAYVVKSDKLSLFTANGEDAGIETDIDFTKYISQNSMIVPLRNTVKNDVIRELVDTLEKNGTISNAKEVYDAVLEREKSMSTGLGGGLAFPRARCSAVENITVAIGVSQNSIEFGSIDKKPVHIVMLILSPQKDSTPYLQFLSEMSRALLKPNINKKIANAKTPEELYRILKEKNW